jgi:hypothetical protein
VSRGLWVYLGTLLVLTALGWGTFLIRGPIQHKMKLHESLSCCPGYQYSDFVDLSLRVAHFGEPHMLTRNDFTLPYLDPQSVPYPYPVPSVYAFLIFLRLFPNHALTAYLIFVMFAFLAATGYLSLRVRRLTGKQLPQIAIWATLLCAYPLLILIDRANIEAFIWVLVLLGLAAFTRNRMLLAAILWAVAASMKIFPGFLFFLFLARRRYGMFAAAVAFMVLFSVLALAGIGPTIHQAAMESSQSTPFLRDNYILALYGPQFDHSIFGAIKQIEWSVLNTLGHGPEDKLPVFRASLRIYTVIVPLGFLVLYWFRLRKLPQLNQFIAYMLLAILLPYVSNEYTLIYVYLVWTAFLLFLLSDVAGNGIRVPRAAIYTIMVSCAVSSVPLNSNTFPEHPAHGGQIKMLFLVLILIAALRFPMPSSLFGDLQASPEKQPQY